MEVELNVTEITHHIVKFLDNQGVFDSNKLDVEYAQQHFDNLKKIDEEKLPTKFKRFKYILWILVQRNVLKVNSYNGDKSYTVNKNKVKEVIEKKVSYQTSPANVRLVSQNKSFKQEHKQPVHITEEECKMCSVKFNSKSSYEEHLQSQTHKITEKYYSDKNSFLEEKNVVIEIEDGAENKSEDCIVRPNTESIISAKIKNKSDKKYSIEEYIELNKKLTEVRLNRASLPGILYANSEEEIFFTVQFEELKSEMYILVLIMKDKETDDYYYILKPVVFFVMSEYMDDLYPTVPYKKPIKNIIVDYNDEVIPGEPLPKKPTGKIRLPLKLFRIPPIIISLLNSGLKLTPHMKEAHAAKLKEIREILQQEDPKNCLTVNNYYQILNFLLNAEEHQMSKNIRDYDMETTELLAVGASRFHKLNVPGLAENRPSVIIGDTICVKQEKSNKKYEGIVHGIEETNVILGFSSQFATAYTKGMKLQVSFSINRYTIRTEHQALQLIESHQAIHNLFPTTFGNNSIINTSFKWFNLDIANNIEQQQAITHIFSKTSFPTPYLIFGPPGTGKTSTIVEAIKQIWSLKKNDKILVCAPSNNAANELTKRLITTITQTMDLLRYVATSFPYKDIPSSLLPYCNYDIYKQHFRPTLEKIQTYRIVVSTIVNAARLVNAGIPPGHFSYVFIDESGNCTETETLIPIAGILTSGENVGRVLGQVVLAGDPKQLGPIIHSPLAKQYGLDISMLERLMNTIDIYKRGPDGKYNTKVLTKLVNNYRSHPSILKVPNELFYDEELVPKGDHFINAAVGWEYLKNKNIPLIFHHVVGKDQRESTSPSWFNLNEVEIIVNYIKQLLDSRFQGIKIIQDHIGVIAPYRQQGTKLRRAFAKFNWNNINVGSVEQFQGQEKLIIIISTVRSNSEFLPLDSKFRLGFLKNPKRFNVAITRSKALLIAVGNANVLQHDPCWYKFIKYCVSSNANAGTKFPLLEQPDPVEDILINFSNLNLEKDLKDDSADFSRGNI